MCVALETDFDVRHFVQQSIEIIQQLFKAAAAIQLVCCSPYRHCLSPYLKGESPHTGKFTVHLQYPLTVQSPIFLFQMKPQLPHCWLSTPLCWSLFVFSDCGVTGLWFSHYSQHTGNVLWQNRSLSLFPLLSEDHKAKFNTNNKISGAQNTHFHIHRSLI